MQTSGHCGRCVRHFPSLISVPSTRPGWHRQPGRFVSGRGSLIGEAIASSSLRVSVCHPLRIAGAGLCGVSGRGSLVGVKSFSPLPLSGVASSCQLSHAAHGLQRPCADLTVERRLQQLMLSFPLGAAAKRAGKVSPWSSPRSDSEHFLSVCKSIREFVDVVSHAEFAR